MIINEIHQLFLKNHHISTDSRKIQLNDIFFALKGDNFNGNLYADKALELGAAYAVIDDPQVKTSEKHILVDDVLTALQDLARHHRQHLNIPIIALTGSNGKTTTKELINCVLSTTFNTTATVGNLNNHIGVPLTILSMTKETEIGIIEMGANHIGEIDFLCNITQPDYGYITNIGKAHLEGFKSIEGVLQGKTELYKHLKKNNKLIFLNQDDYKLLKASKDIKTYSFSTLTNSNCKIHLKDTTPNVEVRYQNKDIKSNLIGSYNFTNIAAAITIGSYFKVHLDQIKNAIESYTPTNNRSQILKKGKHTIILDAYNANPSSMEAAISNFNNLKEDSKIVFLGDMFELGTQSHDEHQKIVNHICNTRTVEIYLIGKLFFTTESTDSRIKKFKTFEELEINKSIRNQKNTILIKGSRGMKLERILDFL